MTHFVSFTVSTKPGVSPSEVKRWLMSAMIAGMQTMPNQIGNVGSPDVRCNEYVEPTPEPEVESQAEIKDFLCTLNVHPSVIKQYLTLPDGSLRKPTHSEWTEDYGLGYANRIAWELARGERQRGE